MLNKLGTIFGGIILAVSIAVPPQADAITRAKDNKNFSGLADYYADMYHGKKTASGALHDKTKLMAAHRTLPFGTKVRIVNHRTKKSCVVVINDRGPFTPNKVIDVSYAAAKELGLFASGNKLVDCSVVEED